MTQPRLLLLSPGFHGYWRGMSAALTQRGYSVTTGIYDHLPTRKAKAHHKLRYELADRFGSNGTAARIEHISARMRALVYEVKPDVALVVKGDLLDASVWQALDEVGASTTLWMYDEIRRTEWTPEKLKVCGAVASYSKADTAALNAAGVACAYVPLAFDASTQITQAPAVPEVSFIGARYPQREALLSEVHQSGVPVRAYGRDWSHDWRDKARTWNRQRPDLPADRDLDRSHAYGVMAASTATLNIHGDQDGFTMRTFEAPGVGSLPLVDRAEVSEFYDVGTEALVFSGADEIIDYYQRAYVEPLWASSIRQAGQHRTLAEHTFAHRMNALEELWT